MNIIISWTSASTASSLGFESPGSGRGQSKDRENATWKAIVGSIGGGNSEGREEPSAMSLLRQQQAGITGTEVWQIEEYRKNNLSRIICQE
jgi:hypothetical protein